MNARPEIARGNPAATAARRWPVTRSAAAIRADLEHSPDDAQAWADIDDGVTEAERFAHWSAVELVLASRFPLVVVGRDEIGPVYGRAERAPVVVPPQLLELPALPEPACVLLAALREVPYPRSWSELAARFGVMPQLAESELHAPTLLAARAELLRARLIRRSVLRSVDDAGDPVTREVLEVVR